MKIVSVILFILFASAGFAQSLVTTSDPDSSLVVIRDSRFDDLVERQKKENLLRRTIPGYRVQIFFGSNRQKATDVKSDFSSKFPDVPAYISYQQPNFKIRVGDYRSRFEAQRMMSELNGMYPTTFIVPDEISLPPLK